jgi:hypothetical protein
MGGSMPRPGFFRNFLEKVDFFMYIIKKKFMYKNTKIHRIDHEKLIERYKELGNAKKTALEFGLSGPTVLKIIRSHGVEVNRELKKYSDEYVISKYYEFGTAKKTSIELGMGKQRVIDILDRNNIKRRTLKHVSIGDVFNKLTVVEFLGYYGTRNKSRLFLCKCECGGTREVESRKLTRVQKPIKDCGCGWKLKRERAELKRKEKERARQLRLEKRIERELKNKLKREKYESNKKYKVGSKHNRLTIISVVGKGENKILTVECECGTIKDIKRHSIYTTKSCGCLQKERSTTHGMVTNDKKKYDRWRSMISRCHNPKSKSYHNYGGRGIYVCDRWRLPNGEGCKNYLEDIKKHLGPKPEGNYSLDRIDNDGPYEITNLRWADVSTQNKNQRRWKKVDKDQCKIDF